MTLHDRAVAALERGGRRELAGDRAAGRVLELDAPFETLPGDAAALDTVVCRFVLCRVADVAVALAEIHRVLAPGGQLLFVEHGPARSHAVAALQRAAAPAWARVTGGCRLDRDTIGALRANRFVVDECERLAPLGGPTAGMIVRGRAIKRSGS